MRRTHRVLATLPLLAPLVFCPARAQAQYIRLAPPTIRSDHTVSSVVFRLRLDGQMLGFTRLAVIDYRIDASPNRRRDATRDVPSGRVERQGAAAASPGRASGKLTADVHLDSPALAGALQSWFDAGASSAAHAARPLQILQEDATTGATHLLYTFIHAVPVTGSTLGPANTKAGPTAQLVLQFDDMQPRPQPPESTSQSKGGIKSSNGQLPPHHP